MDDSSTVSSPQNRDASANSHFDSRPSDSSGARHFPAPPPVNVSPAPGEDWEVGAVLAKRFQLTGPLNERRRGNQSLIYLARDTSCAREVVVKVPDLSQGNRDNVLARFRREVEITVFLQQPGIPVVLAHGEYAGTPYMVMQRIEGQPFDLFLNGKACGGEQFETALAAVDSLCRLVARAHDLGVVHRDLKSNNLILDKYLRALTHVLDWGSAGLRPGCALANAHVTTNYGAAPTTPIVAAPEYFTDADRSAPSGDVFALGAILSDVLVGRDWYPFGNRAPVDEPQRAEMRAARRGALEAALAESGPRGDPRALLLALALKCLDDAPDARPSDATAVVKQIEAYRAKVTQLADENLRIDLAKEVAVSVEREHWRSKRRHLMVAFGATVLCLVAVIVSGVVAWCWDREKRERRSELEASARARRAEAEVARAKDRASGARALMWARHALDGPAPALTEVDVALALADEKLTDPTDPLRAELSELRKDRDLSAALDQIDEKRWLINEDGRQFDVLAVRDRYVSVFAAYGLPDGTPVTEIADRVRRSAIRDRLCRTYERWFESRGSSALEQIVNALDPDKTRIEIRKAYRSEDAGAIAKHAAELDGAAVPPSFARFVAGNPLTPTADRIRIAEGAQARYPGDFGLAMTAALAHPPEARAKRVHYFSIAVALRPNNAAARLNLGNALRSVGALGPALRECQWCVTHHPELALAHAGVANVLLRMARPADARDGFRKALDIDKKCAVAHVGLAAAMRDLGDFNGALARYQLAAQHGADPALCHYNAGLIHWDRRDANGAIAEFDEASKKRARYAPAQYGLGLAWRQKGEAAQAKAFLLAALEYDPDYAEAHNALGNLFFDLGLFAKALHHYAEAVRCDPHYAAPHNGWGNVLARRGDKVGAETRYRAALALDPAFGPALLGLGTVQQSRREWTASLATFAEAERCAPDTPTGREAAFLAAFNSGLSHREMGDGDAAARAYIRAAERQPSDFRADYELANVYLKTKRFGDAVRHAKAAVDKGGGAKAHTLLGLVYVSNGQNVQAFREWNAALGIDRFDPQANYNLGIVAHFNKDFRRAVGYARVAVQSDDTFADAHSLLGFCLLQLGDEAGARAAYRRAAELAPAKWGVLLKELPPLQQAPAPRSRGG